jgi:hypothetical protein
VSPTVNIHNTAHIRLHNISQGFEYCWNTFSSGGNRFNEKKIDFVYQYYIT